MQSDTVKTGPIGGLLEQIEDGALNAWEADFMGKLRERYAQYGEKVMLSAKQRETLEQIARGE